MSGDDTTNGDEPQNPDSPQNPETTTEDTSYNPDLDWGPILDSVTSGDLEFNAGDVAAATAAAAQLIVNLDALAQMVHDNGLHRIGAFTNLTSSRELGKAYGQHGAALYDSLKNHAEMVSDQYDTFVMAGKAFAQTEHDTKTDFDHLAKVKDLSSTVPNVPTMPGPPPVLPDGVTNVTVDMTGYHADGTYSLPQFPKSLQGFGGATDTVNITLENKDKLSFDDLLSFGLSIDTVAPYEASVVFGHIASKLTEFMQAYADQIYKLNNSWRGEGAQAAVEAVNLYKDGTKNLVESVSTTAASLDYVSRWLGVTQKNMPDDKGDKGGKCHDHTNEYRDKFEATYVKGMQQTVSVLPVIEIPGASPQEESTGGGDGDPNNPGSPNPNDPAYNPYSDPNSPYYMPNSPNGPQQASDYGGYGTYDPRDERGKLHVRMPVDGTDQYGKPLTDAYGNPLTDEYGNPLTDADGNPLTDQYGNENGPANDPYGNGDPGGGAGDSQQLEQAYDEGYQAGYQQASTDLTGLAGDMPGAPGGGDSAGSPGSPGDSSGGIPGMGGGIPGSPGDSSGGGGQPRKPASSGGKQQGQQPQMPDLSSLLGDSADTSGVNDATPEMPAAPETGGGGGGEQPSTSGAGAAKTPSVDDLLNRLGLGGLQDSEAAPGSAGGGSPGQQVQSPGSALGGGGSPLDSAANGGGSPVDSAGRPTHGGTTNPGTGVSAKSPLESLGEKLRGLADPTGTAQSNGAALGDTLSHLLDPAAAGGPASVPELLERALTAGAEGLKAFGQAVDQGVDAVAQFLSGLLGPENTHGLASGLMELSKVPGLEGLSDFAGQLDPSVLDGAGGGGAGGGGGLPDIGAADAGGGVGDGSFAAAHQLDEPRVDRFPRAELAQVGGQFGDASTGAGQPGQPGTPGQAGSPGAGANPGAGAAGYKRPKYLTSSDFIDEALGDTPFRVKPVIEP